MNQRHCKGKGIFGCFQEKCQIIVRVVATGLVFCDRSGDEGVVSVVKGIKKARRCEL